MATLLASGCWWLRTDSLLIGLGSLWLIVKLITFCVVTLLNGAILDLAWLSQDNHDSETQDTDLGDRRLASQQDIIAVLRCGAERWNAFRQANPRALVLNCASLPDVQLAHADLRAVIFTEADMPRANLTRAMLIRSVLRKSNLRNADLRHANMDGADFFHADLSGADLRDASLAACFLKRANLSGTDLSTAQGLTDAQLCECLGDERTQLPVGLTRPAEWPPQLSVRDGRD